MFELELESLRSSAGRLKAEIMSFNVHDDITKKAASLVDAAVNELEVAAVTRAEEIKNKPGQPHLDGRAGVVGDDDDHEEVEEETEEDDVDADGNVVGKKVVKKTVRKPKAKAKK